MLKRLEAPERSSRQSRAVKGADGKGALAGQKNLGELSALRPKEKSSSPEDLSTLPEQSASAQYQFRRYPSSLAASAVLKINIRLPMASQARDFESCKSFLAAFLRSAFARRSPELTSSFRPRKQSFCGSRAALKKPISTPKSGRWRAGSQPTSEERQSECENTVWARLILRNEVWRLLTDGTRF